MPVHHILRVEIDEAGLEALGAAGMRVAVTRSVEPTRPERLIWLSFSPRVVSTVTWTEGDVRLFFVAQWPLVTGATVATNALSETLTPGGVYAFSFAEGFVKLSEDGAPDCYTLVVRGTSEVHGFGIAENGTLFSDREETRLRALDVIPLAPDSRIELRVTNKVQVFTSTAAPSVVLGDEPCGEAIELDFAERRVWKIRYDAAVGRFIPFDDDEPAA